MRALENTNATQEYQLNDKLAMVITARVSSIGDGDGGMVEAKMVATNNAALGLDRLPNNPRRQAETANVACHPAIGSGPSPVPSA